MEGADHAGDRPEQAEQRGQGDDGIQDAQPLIEQRQLFQGDLLHGAFDGDPVQMAAPDAAGDQGGDPAGRLLAERQGVGVRPAATSSRIWRISVSLSRTATPMARRR